MILDATYVSVWDGSQIRTDCKFNTVTKQVTDVETTDVEELDLNCCEEEFIELPSGEIVKDFTDEDGNVYKEGQRED